MASGPSVCVIVSKGNTGRSTTDQLNLLIGPSDPDVAKQTDPQSLRALYGTDTLLDGFYISNNNHDAIKLLIVIVSFENLLLISYFVKEKFRLSFRIFNYRSWMANLLMNTFRRQQYFA